MKLFNILGTVPRHPSTPGLSLLFSILGTVLRHQPLELGDDCPTWANRLQVQSPGKPTFHVDRNVSSGPELYKAQHQPELPRWSASGSAAAPPQGRWCLQGPPDCGKQLFQALNVFLLTVTPCSFSVILSERTCFNLLSHYTQPPPPSSTENSPCAGSDDSWVSSSQNIGDVFKDLLQDLIWGLLNSLHSCLFSPKKVLHDPRYMSIYNRYRNQTLIINHKHNYFKTTLWYTDNFMF